MVDASFQRFCQTRCFLLKHYISNNNLDLYLSSQEIDNEERYYFVWQDHKRYCLHIATVFSDHYKAGYDGVLEAALLHIKNLHASVASATLPSFFQEHINIKHFDLLTSSKRIPILGAKFIGGSKEDKLRTINSFML